MSTPVDTSGSWAGSIDSDSDTPVTEPPSTWVNPGQGADTRPRAGTPAAKEAARNAQTHPQLGRTPGLSGTATGVTDHGRKPVLPGPTPTPDWPVRADPVEQWLSDQDTSAHEADLGDLLGVNKEMTRLRLQLIRTRRLMAEAGRRRVDAEAAYERALRRKILTVDGKTVAEREAYAQIACEEFENAKLVAKALHEETIQMHRTVRDELDAVSQVANNLRAEMALAK